MNLIPPASSYGGTYATANGSGGLRMPERYMGKLSARSQEEEKVKRLYLFLGKYGLITGAGRRGVGLSSSTWCVDHLQYDV